MSTVGPNELSGSNSQYKQVRLKIRHPGCWTLDTTNECPDTRIIEKSLYPSEDDITADLILIADGETSLSAFIETIDNHDVVDSVTILKQTDTRARVLVVYERTSSIVPSMANTGFVPIVPVHVYRGYEYWTMMARTDRLGNIIETLQQNFDVTIEAIHGFTEGSAVEFDNICDQINSELSPRQRECLLAAAGKGYYEWPRQTSAKEIATELDISGPTFLEHLRIGEHKVMQHVLHQLERTPEL
ncbi:helix-turn-helix domain-containing protein [Haloprofundus salinisoli]|uniref:helix-turn-helix domain-containing protein n=1 Tax=Haloprofundus salinisoli TaxID=2876193 RepID=UPI001CCB4984|nr:helix-turn-helix domain-containing protein [Haloprofundus salinisoli]